MLRLVLVLNKTLQYILLCQMYYARFAKNIVTRDIEAILLEPSFLQTWRSFEMHRP
jgi:hypothetical protein